VASLNQSRQRLAATTVRVERADALGWMARAAPATFDLVLLDPPFDANVSAAATQAATRLVAAGGFVYLESPQALAELPAGWVPHRQLRAGAVHAQLLLRQD
jgi:16S rRNA (guanine966-N2)-methyltransferase